MKTFSTLILSLTLISAMASSASAYHFFPKDTKIALRGVMTFYPGGPPFKCKVTFYLKTKGEGGGIKSYKIDNGPGCANLRFDMPMYTGILSDDSGQIGPFGFLGGGGQCSQGIIQFTVNKSGVFKFPSGQCMSGVMTSHPTTIIEGKP